LSKIKAGEIDLLVNALSFDLLRFFEKIPPKNFTIQESSGLNTSYLAFNFKDPILKKPEVRKAIQLAIDRKEIIDSIYGGKAKLANSLLLKEDPFHLDIELQTRDQKLAGKLLDQAGYPDPDGTGPQKRFSLEYSTSTNSFRILVAKAIASQLESIGIEVKVVSKEWGKFKADIDQGKAQMWSLRWIGYKDPSIYHYAFSSESFPPNGGNRGYYSNSELDRLLNQGMIELDSSERKSIYKKVQKIIADDRPYIHLWHENNIALLRKEWSGFQLYADGRFDSIVRIQPKK
jgi:peptide/nickel transport system substrate-binding protein